MDDDVLGQAVHEVTALDLHGHFGVQRIGGADLDLDLLCGALTDQQVVLALDEGDDGLIEHITCHAHAAGGHDAAQRDHSDLSRSAADIHDHAAGRLADGQARTDGCCHGFLNDGHLTGTGLQGSFAHSAALHLGNAGRDADDHAGAGEHAVAACLLEEIFQHVGGDVKVSDHAILQRTHSHDAAGGTANDSLCLGTHTAHLVGLGIHSHDRRLPHDDALALHIYQSICGTQIDTYIFRKQAHCKNSPYASHFIYSARTSGSPFVPPLRRITRFYYSRKAMISQAFAQVFFVFSSFITQNVPAAVRCGSPADP